MSTHIIGMHRDFNRESDQNHGQPWGCGARYLQTPISHDISERDVVPFHEMVVKAESAGYTMEKSTFFSA